MYSNKISEGKLNFCKQTMNIVNNKIGDSGLEQLCRDGSKNFMMLELGMIEFIQEEMSLRRNASSHFPDKIGTT